MPATFFENLVASSIWKATTVDPVYEAAQACTNPDMKRRLYKAASQLRAQWEEGNRWLGDQGDAAFKGNDWKRGDLDTMLGR